MMRVLRWDFRRSPTATFASRYDIFRVRVETRVKVEPRICARI